MKKIPTLFKRTFDENNVVSITNEVTEGLEGILDGEGIATVKWDGACVMVKNGMLYKRYDAKNGKTPPEGAIPCCDPDPVTGHWPHWVVCDYAKSEDKWLCEAYLKAQDHMMSLERRVEDGTYEVIGPKFQGNPYNLNDNIMLPHGSEPIRELNYGTRTFERIRHYLETHNVEGIVFWKDGKPVCKIKRTDFGLKWPERWVPNA